MPCSSTWLYYELRNRRNHVGGRLQYILKRDPKTDGYLLDEQTGDTPQFYHVAALEELWQVAQSGQVKTFHFNIFALDSGEDRLVSRPPPFLGVHQEGR